MRTNPVIVEIPQKRAKSTQHPEFPVINVTGDGTYGSIMMRQIVHTFSKGFFKREDRVGHLAGRVKDLEDLCSNINLQEGDNFSAKMGSPVRMTVIEQTTPAYEGQEPKINVETGETLMTAEGEYIYRTVKPTFTSSEEAVDKLIQHVTEATRQGEQVAETEFAGESEK